MISSRRKNKTQIDLTHYLQRYSSKLLWHFTGYRKSHEKAYKKLREIIISQKLIAREEPVVMNDGQKRPAYGRVCLADIPFKDLRLHVQRYKAYGICFYKKHAIRRGYFNPVFYIHRRHPFFKETHHLFKKIDSVVPENKKFKKGSLEYSLDRHLKMLGAYVKLGFLDKPVTNSFHLDKAQKNNFYFEREWRASFDWKLRKGDVHSLMVPKKYVKKFKAFFRRLKGDKKLSDAFKDVPIISSDMIEEL